MSGQQLVTNTLAEEAGLARATVDRYTELLDAVFLVYRLRPWSRNPLAQAVRRPKVHLVDTGLLCHLQRRLVRHHASTGGPRHGRGQVVMLPAWASATGRRRARQLKTSSRRHQPQLGRIDIQASHRVSQQIVGAAEGGPL